MLRISTISAKTRYGRRGGPAADQSSSAGRSHSGSARWRYARNSRAAASPPLTKNQIPPGTVMGMPELAEPVSGTTEYLLRSTLAQLIGPTVGQNGSAVP